MLLTDTLLPHALCSAASLDQLLPASGQYRLDKTGTETESERSEQQSVSGVEWTPWCGAGCAKQHMHSDVEHFGSLTCFFPMESVTQ